LYMNQNYRLNYIINRVAMCSFFTLFSLIVFSWLQVLGAQYALRNRILPKLKVAFIALNVTMYLIEIVTSTLYQIERGDRGDTNGSYRINAWYTVNMAMTAFINAFLALVCGVIGFQLYLFLRSRSILHNQAKLILAVSSLMVVCLIIKIVFLIDRPVLNNDIAAPPYYIFAYFVPECLPLGTQLTLYWKRIQILEEKVDEEEVRYSKMASRTKAKVSSSSLPHKQIADLLGPEIEPFLNPNGNIHAPANGHDYDEDANQSDLYDPLNTSAHNTPRSQPGQKGQSGQPSRHQSQHSKDLNLQVLRSGGAGSEVTNPIDTSSAENKTNTSDGPFVSHNSGDHDDIPYAAMKSDEEV